MNSNSNTIVGVFDTLDAAERARDELQEAGIGSTDIRVIAPDDVRDDDAGRSDSDERSMGDKVSDFFSSLIGDSDEEKVGEHYLEKARSGSSLLVVDVDRDDPDETARVRGIVESATASGVRHHQRRDTSTGATSEQRSTTDARSTGETVDNRSTADSV